MKPRPPLRVVFTGVGEVSLESDGAAPGVPGPGEVLVATDHSLVSAGTELACLSGAESSWFAFPSVPGSISVGRVTASGAGVGLPLGTRLLSDSGHRGFCVVDVASSVCFPVPGDVDPVHAPFARPAMAALTALRVGDVELGDRVLVTGLGVLGVLVSQLLALQGASVTAVDLAPARVQVARACGVDATVQPEDLDGGCFDAVVEATGRPDAALAHLDRLVRGGEILLLGTPRGEHGADVTPLLRAVHHAGSGVTLRGAHEGVHPVRATPGQKHSVERNAAVVFELLAAGALEVDPLVSLVAAPHEAPAVYRRLAERDPALVGVLFDWSRAGEGPAS